MIPSKRYPFFFLTPLRSMLLMPSKVAISAEPELLGHVILLALPPSPPVILPLFTFVSITHFVLDFILLRVGISPR